MLRHGFASILAAFSLPLALGAAVAEPGVQESAAREAWIGPPAAPGATERNPATGPAGATAGESRVPTAVAIGHGQQADTEITAAGQSAWCPADMVLVEGSYCTQVRQVCKRWLDDPSLQYARCAEYEPEAKCAGKRVPMRYCIDRYEAAASGGDELPANQLSYVKGAKLCKSQGKRLCLESEWNFACEGEEMRPYPYGWSREPKCNQDRADLYTGGGKDLKDNRQPRDANPECASPFGVMNMVGNVDETVARDGAQHNHPFRNALKGGWWMAGRNRCRPATTAHDDYYEDIQVGVRCCADAPGDDPVAKG
jgi:hypothetical protein